MANYTDGFFVILGDIAIILLVFLVLWFLLFND